ncbi:hypothetical protein BLNAU_8836 [Blattamonas nauphoetae]|uniref:Uncharacterized protein n=1 Tax=Blattamonas nauphoetae TaxID=2049346 RepID=A0ABQ9XXT5_9EUKA|nr:hypothetical protein BLNAU_8836 [Blattamonas nauphoetae]
MDSQLSQTISPIDNRPPYHVTRSEILLSRHAVPKGHMVHTTHPNSAYSHLNIDSFFGQKSPPKKDNPQTNPFQSPPKPLTGQYASLSQTLQKSFTKPSPPPSPQVTHTSPSRPTVFPIRTRPSVIALAKRTNQPRLHNPQIRERLDRLSEMVANVKDRTLSLQNTQHTDFNEFEDRIEEPDLHTERSPRLDSHRDSSSSLPKSRTQHTRSVESLSSHAQSHSDPPPLSSSPPALSEHHTSSNAETKETQPSERPATPPPSPHPPTLHRQDHPPRRDSFRRRSEGQPPLSSDHSSHFSQASHPSQPKKQVDQLSLSRTISAGRLLPKTHHNESNHQSETGSSLRSSKSDSPDQRQTQQLLLQQLTTPTDPSTSSVASPGSSPPASSSPVSSSPVSSSPVSSSPVSSFPVSSSPANSSPIQSTAESHIISNESEQQMSLVSQCSYSTNNSGDEQFPPELDKSPPPKLFPSDQDRPSFRIQETIRCTLERLKELGISLDD